MSRRVNFGRNHYQVYMCVVLICIQKFVSFKFKSLFTDKLIIYTSMHEFPVTTDHLYMVEGALWTVPV